MIIKALSDKGVVYAHNVESDWEAIRFLQDLRRLGNVIVRWRLHR